MNSVGPSDPSPESPHYKPSKPISKEPPVIQEPLVDVVISPNKKVTLSCVVSGTPSPAIKWFKNGIEITTSNTVYDNSIAKLIIDNTTEDTSAKYTCLAENEIGKTETSCFILVQEKPSITIEDKYINQTLRTETEWKINGTISGFPQPEITWYKNSTIVKTDISCNIIYENNTSTIIIKSLHRTDSGKYTIEAKNESGTATVDCNLTVIGKILI